MKSFAKVCLILVTAVTMAASTARAQADSSATSTNTPPAAKPKPKAPRFNGKITSVDSDAKTITITMANGTTHVLHITSDTKFKKDGEPAVMADATVGQKIRGAYKKDDSGDWVARTVDIGEPKPRTLPPSSSTSTNK
jgi:hypothetical protein